MELKEVEKRCCVINISGGVLKKKPVSCSGVIVHPQTGSIVCTGLPFSRFITDRRLLSSAKGLLLPRSLNGELKIRVSFPDPGAAKTPRRKRPKQREVSAELLMLVHCNEFRKAFLGVFKEADQWRFHGDGEADQEDEELLRDAQFLSWFAVLRTGVLVNSGPDSETIPWQSSSCLQKGSPVVACGSPFGSLCLDLFISTLSRGVISNLSGEDNAIILTDARCLPGTEGGGLFVVNGGDTVHLVGLIVAPFGWKSNEWIGLALVCSIQLIFRNIIQFAGAHDPHCDTWIHQGATDLHMSLTAHEGDKYPMVCFVDSGQFWGSGVIVTTKLVVTCRHVVGENSSVTLKLHHKDRVRDVVGVVLFTTKTSSPYDLAFVELKVPISETDVPQMSERFDPGEAVLVVGYGGLGRACGPSVTCGILSKVIAIKKRPVMLQTTCAVQAGASGGAVVRKHSGELLGIVSSNARDVTAGVTYPHLNFIIPVSVFQRLLQEFQRTQEVDAFRGLNMVEKEIRRVWRLQGSQSKL